jgi:hypothetical protein
MYASEDRLSRGAFRLVGLAGEKARGLESHSTQERQQNCILSDAPVLQRSHGDGTGECETCSGVGGLGSSFFFWKNERPSKIRGIPSDMILAKDKKQRVIRQDLPR